MTLRPPAPPHAEDTPQAAGDPPRDRGAGRHRTGAPCPYGGGCRPGREAEEGGQPREEAAEAPGRHAGGDHLSEGGGEGVTRADHELLPPARGMSAR